MRRCTPSTPGFAPACSRSRPTVDGLDVASIVSGSTRSLGDCETYAAGPRTRKLHDVLEWLETQDYGNRLRTPRRRETRDWRAVAADAKGDVGIDAVARASR